LPGGPSPFVIDTAGHCVVPPGIYNDIDEFSDGYAIAYRDRRYFVIDESGKVILARPEKDSVNFYNEEFHDGLISVILQKPRARPDKEYHSSDDQFEGYMDIHGRIVLADTTVWQAPPFSNRRSFLKRKDWTNTLINTRMEPVGNTLYKWVDEKGFINGHAYVQAEAGYGIIDTNGRFTATPVLQEFDRAGFQHGLLSVIIDNRPAFINTKGTIVWQAPPDNTLHTLNIDYLMRGYFYAGSSKKGTPLNAPSATLSLVIDTGTVDTFAQHYQGYAEYLTNTTIGPYQFDSEDGRLEMQVQALDEDGNWRYIDYLPRSWCGNSYHTVELEPFAYWKFTMPRFEGEWKTKLRIEVFYKRHHDQGKPLYSNMIAASINPGQFWNKHQYSPQNFMDPYND